MGWSLGRRVSRGRPGERPGEQRPGSGCSVLSRPHHSNRFSGALPPSAPQQPGKGDYPHPCDPARPTLRNPLAPPCILIPAEKAAIEARPLGLSRHGGACPPTFPGKSCLPGPPRGRGQTQTRGPGTGEHSPHLPCRLDGTPTTEEPEVPSSQSPQSLCSDRTSAAQQGGRWRRSWVPRAGPCADLSGAPRC